MWPSLFTTNSNGSGVRAAPHCTNRGESPPPPPPAADGIASVSVFPKFRGTAALVMAALAMIVGLSGPAGAQEPERGVTVRDRARADYDSIGLRAGPFLLFPAVGVGSRYDDNIYREQEQEDGDLITSLRPGVRAESQWSNHELTVEAGAEADYHRSWRDEDTTDWFANIAGRLDVRRDTHVTASLNAGRRHEDRGNPNAAATRKPVTYDRFSAGLGAFHRLNRLSLTAAAAMEVLVFDDGIHPETGAAVRQDHRDRTQSMLRFRAGYAILPGYEAFVRASHNQRSYERSHRGGIDRDSTGWELVAGTTMDLGGIITGEVFAGVRGQDYAALWAPSITHSAFGGVLDWNVTRLTTISGSVTRTVEESTLSGASGFLATEARLRVDHELLRNLILDAQLTFTRSAYEGIGREDDVLWAEPGGTWLVNRRLRLDFGYRLGRRDSTVAGSDYESGILHLTARLQL